VRLPVAVDSFDGGAGGFLLKATQKAERQCPLGGNSSNPATTVRTFASPEGVTYTSPGDSHSCFREARMRHWSVTTVLIFMIALILALPVRAQQKPFTQD
jgi:hypothetical protein